MKLIVNARHIKTSNEIHAHIDRRIAFAFSRSRKHVRTVLVKLTDINGPRGGIDKQCKVVVRLYSRPSIVIVERQADIHHAIDRCITRASRNLMQQLKRKQHSLQGKLSYLDVDYATRRQAGGVVREDGDFIYP